MATVLRTGALPKIFKTDRMFLFYNKIRHFNLPEYYQYIASPNMRNCLKYHTFQPRQSVNNSRSIFRKGRLCAQTFYFATYTDDQLKKTIDGISEKFSEAISLLDDARNSMGTTYFSSDMNEAEEMVNETLKDYEDLIAQLGEKQRTTVTRSIGLKMQELKAQMQIIRDSVRD